MHCSCFEISRWFASMSPSPPRPFPTPDKQRRAALPIFDCEWILFGNRVAKMRSKGTVRPTRPSSLEMGDHNLLYAAHGCEIHEVMHRATRPVQPPDLFDRLWSARCAGEKETLVGGHFAQGWVAIDDAPCSYTRTHFTHTHMFEHAPYLISTHTAPELPMIRHHLHDIA